MQYTKLKQAFNNISIIPEEDWLLCEPYYQIQQFAKNEYFLKTGEIDQQIGFINKGSFRWYYLNSKGEEVNFYFFFENDFVVDFESFLTQIPSNKYIQAMEDAEIVLLPKHDKILEAYEKSHNWAQFGRKIAETVYLVASNRVQDFLFRNAEERYIQLLEQRPDIFQRVSLSNIASYLGIQGPSLSRLRKRISKR